MRPVPDLPPFLQKSPFDHPSPSLDPCTTAPATFFLSRTPHASDHEPGSLSDDSDDQKESMYGVQSLGDTLSQSEMSARLQGLSADHCLTNSPSQGLAHSEEPQSQGRTSTIKACDSDVHGSPSLLVVSDTASRPLTPLNPDDPSSLPSSPKSVSNRSLRPLDEISITDEINSQAVESGDEDERTRTSPNIGPGGPSQFIMPSLKMPSRRPFTERGKAMGRFKVLLAGAPGSGKTSLIKSIVQVCDDIVHVDSLDSRFSVTSLERRRPSRPRSGPVPTRGVPAAVTEIYASTKPYPSWWSDLEDSRILRRRKSIGEIVLERNLCFVDTPTTTLSRAGQTDSILQYMRQQLYRATTALDGSGVDFQNLLAGNGGSQVDAILFLISSDTLRTDIDCIRKLHELGNVIPVVAKADTMSSDQIKVLKNQFHQQASDAGIKPFLFGDSSESKAARLEEQPPYAASSEKATDSEVMDASTLMNPDYVQPLVASELQTLVQQLFERDNMAWMRHMAAKKLLAHARNGFPSVPPTTAPLHNALSGTTIGVPGWRVASGTSLNSSVSSVGESPASYAMARFADYARHEEQLAQIRLARWATDLQRSLQNERDRYAALARADRAVWLTERLGECVIDGSLVPITQTPRLCGQYVPANESENEKIAGALRATVARSGTSKGYHAASVSLHDPLGIVSWMDGLGRRGWVLVRIVGSVGVVGGLALWLARTWGLSTKSLPELQLDHWYGSIEQ